RLELLKVTGEVPQRAVLDRRAGLPQLLPVVELADHAVALGADDLGGGGEVAAQLGVDERDLRRLGERGHTHEGVAHDASSLTLVGRTRGSLVVDGGVASSITGASPPARPAPA